MATLVLTVLGDDRPGLVQSIADVITAQGGNWERSQLAQLAGKFAGLVEVSVDAANSDALVAALSNVAGLDVSVRSGGAPAAAVRSIVLDLVGNAHPGIVAEVTAALAEHGVNIERLDTSTEQAPMAGGTLFRARAELSAPTGVDVTVVAKALETLADELMVEVSLDEPEAS